jgi:hypothetical protein
VITKQYRKTAATEAVVWDGTPGQANEIVNWINGAGGRCTAAFRDDGNRVAIATLEGTMLAAPGDAILRGNDNEFWPCRGDIFARTYEPVGEAS